MRISPAGLLVVIAITIPLLVEIRTVLAYFRIDLTALEALLIGVLVIVGIVVWALLPETAADCTNESNGG